MGDIDNPSRRRANKPIKVALPLDQVALSKIPLDEVQTAADFGQCLDTLRHLAGPLSNREIELMSGNRLGRTKIGHALKGERPRREFVQVYLQVCGVPEDEHARWFEVWTQLAGDLVISPESAREQAVEIRRKAEAEAAEVLAAAQAEAARIREDNAWQVHRAEARRDEALKRVNELAGELDRMHEATFKRVRDVEEDRDTAVQRAESLSIELDRMHEATLKRVRDVEEDRDTAVARARNMSIEIDAMHNKMVELRDQLTSSTKEMATEIGAELEKINDELSNLREQITKIGGTNAVPGQPAKPRKTYGNDDQWTSARLFDDDRTTPPPVIGA